MEAVGSGGEVALKKGSLPGTTTFAEVTWEPIDALWVSVWRT